METLDGLKWFIGGLGAGLFFGWWLGWWHLWAGARSERGERPDEQA